MGSDGFSNEYLGYPFIFRAWEGSKPVILRFVPG